MNHSANYINKILEKYSGENNEWEKNYALSFLLFGKSKFYYFYNLNGYNE